MQPSPICFFYFFDTNVLFCIQFFLLIINSQIIPCDGDDFIFIFRNSMNDFESLVRLEYIDSENGSSWSF